MVYIIGKQWMWNIGKLQKIERKNISRKSSNRQKLAVGKIKMAVGIQTEFVLTDQNFEVADMCVVFGCCSIDYIRKIWRTKQQDVDRISKPRQEGGKNTPNMVLTLMKYALLWLAVSVTSVSAWGWYT